MLHFEDLTPGLRFHTATVTIDQASLLAFAHQYDPQAFHTDPLAAEDSVFGGLAASGWHTASLSMRLIVDSEFGRSVAGGLVGMGIDKLRWPRPTRAGDTLRTEIEILGNRRSSSHPGHGVVQLRWTTRNQHDEVVMSLENAIWVPLRTPTPAR